MTLAENKFAPKTIFVNGLFLHMASINILLMTLRKLTSVRVPAHRESWASVWIREKLHRRHLQHAANWRRWPPHFCPPKIEWHRAYRLFSNYAPLFRICYFPKIDDYQYDPPSHGYSLRNFVKILHRNG